MKYLVFLSMCDAPITILIGISKKYLKIECRHRGGERDKKNCFPNPQIFTVGMKRIGYLSGKVSVLKVGIENVQREQRYMSSSWVHPSTSA